MATRKNHRRPFGTVRRLPSGRYQVRYTGPDGLRRAAPDTFRTKRDAEQWMSVTESELVRGDWADPLRGSELLADFGARWIAEHRVSQRVREEYDSLWRHHLDPYLGTFELAQITTETVRSWRTALLRDGRSEDRTAKAYRLLRAMLNTAVDDGAIKRNPCRIKGAGEYRAPERPVANVAQVYSLADAMPDRFRALVLTAAFSGLRWGELIALRRCDVDLDHGILRVSRRLAQTRTSGLQEGPTKSAAGVRNVALPAIVIEDLRDHIDEYAQAGAEGLIFVGDKGAMLRRSNFGRSTDWTKTVIDVGLPAGFHFHDLRHTGNQLAANAGATTKELMHRMGHGSMRAALIYQHATTERDRAIADALSVMVEAARTQVSDS